VLVQVEQDQIRQQDHHQAQSRGERGWRPVVSSPATGPTGPPFQPGGRPTSTCTRSCARTPHRGPTPGALPSPTSAAPHTYRRRNAGRGCHWLLPPQSTVCLCP
jgi:hypothetical protein